MPHLQKSIIVGDRSAIGEARRAAVAAAEHLQFNEDRRSDISIVATELATNIIQHAQRGEVLICPVEAGATWLDILALDSGPGIREISRALEDGISTGGTAGQGLGAVRRLADQLSIFSTPGGGTAVFCRFNCSQREESVPFGVVSIPVQGEFASGDSYLAIPGPFRSLYMVVDGLGHGVIASEAAREAVKAVKAATRENLTEIISVTHNALRSTRGAAMSIACVDHERSLIAFAGVGNVSAMVGKNGFSRSMISHNGTLGVKLPKIQEYTYPFERGMMLLMFSDGLTSKCGFTGYPGIFNRPPALIAGLLYRDFTRRRDDATALVAELAGDRA